VTNDVYEDFVNFLVINHFSEKAAREITDRVLQTCTMNHSGEVLEAYAKSVQKLRKRLGYDQPIYSIVEYFFRLVAGELRPSYLQERTREKEAPIMPIGELGDLLCHFSRSIGAVQNH
jgi:hypothetical protein